MPARYYPARMLRWLDADTCEVEVDQGFGGKQGEQIRLLDYDAPEEGEPLAEDATQRANMIAPVGSLVQLESHKNRNGKEARSFIRYLGRITNAYGIDVAVQLEREGLTKSASQELKRAASHT